MSTIPRKKAGVRTRRFTKDEYYRMADLGFFHGQRVELIEGQLMVASPQNAEHSSSVFRTMMALQHAFGPSYLVRSQFPIDFGPTTEPEPDIAVVIGPVTRYDHAHPTTAVLIVEVSDTSLAYDRGRKGSLYARAGIQDYWIVNLKQRQLELFRSPIADASEPFGHRYASRSDIQIGGAVSPLAVPTASILVADLIP